MPDQRFTFAKSIATVSLSGTLPEKLEAAAAVGFDGVEIFENDLLTYDGSPADIRRIAEGLGLEITIFQPFRDFEAMPGRIFGYATSIVPNASSTYDRWPRLPGQDHDPLQRLALEQHDGDQRAGERRRAADPALPGNGVIYVQNGSGGCGASRRRPDANYAEPPSLRQPLHQRHVYESMTLAAANDIIIGRRTSETTVTWQGQSAPTPCSG